MKRQLISESERIEETLQEIRDSLAVDRVALYQFLADGSGEVLAETRNQVLPSLRHLRFPASDIPQSARKQFLEEKVRILVDVELGRQLHQLPYRKETVPYHAPSPCHLQYLEKLQVKASLTLPILIRGELWGLLLIHHSQNHRWQESQLALLELLSERVTLLITTDQLLKEQKAFLYRQQALKAIQDLISPETDSLPMQKILQAVVQYMGGCGGRITRRGFSGKSEMYQVGDQPLKKERGESFLGAGEQCLLPRQEVCLPEEDSCASIYEVASQSRRGCTALTISLSCCEEGYLTIFRYLQPQTICWAGRPPQSPEEKKRVRESFAPWREETQLSAVESWTREDIKLGCAIAQLLANNFQQLALHKAVTFQENYHPLTQFPNRSLLMEHLSLLTHDKTRENKFFAVVFLDLDRFQQVNNTLGHIAGDKLLQLVAERFRHNFQDQNVFLAHWHGDKFVILLRHLSNLNSNELEAKISAIGEVFQAPFSLLGHEVYVKASWGVAIYPYDGADGETLLLNAETAMYSAKEQGRNRYQVYSPSLRSPLNPVTLETEIRNSLQNNDFRLYYQPQMNLHRGKITAVEALIRWQHPKRGLLSPGQFIPFAEESDLICELGEWVIREACEQLALWEKQGICPLRMAVNVSARCFQKVDFVEKLKEILRESGVSPSQLEIEITETALAHNSDLTGWILEQLQEMGVSVALDDFGMGYSSMNAIKQFPLNTVKIDRAFIKGLNGDRKDRAIVESILTLARGLNLRVVAEGIETLQQLEHLQAMATPEQEIQGYFISEPLPVEDAIAFLLDWTPSMLAKQELEETVVLPTTKEAEAENPKNAATSQLQQLFNQAHREQLVAKIAQQVHGSLDLKEIFQVTVEAIRDFLDTDRVILYRFDEDWKGQVVIEAVGEEWESLYYRRIDDPCFQLKSAPLYARGRVCAIADIETIEMSPCYQEMLRSFQVRANLVIPILNQSQLWGLLIAHHCRSPRPWQPTEISLLEQLATQVGVAIHQAELYQQLQQANQQLQEMAIKDGLTKIVNRRCFDQTLDYQWQRLQREQQPLTLILCDIDEFKPYNDEYGHQAGDDCLVKVAAALFGVAQRPDDLVARYGGEEFAIILPNTPAEKAMVVAERARKAVAALKIPHQRSSVAPHVTISLGVGSVIPTPNQTRKTLIYQADQALYAAKARGRDRAMKSPC